MNPKISLHKLFLTLLSPLTSNEYTALPGDETLATTIRLEPEVRRFYEDAAKELGISLQSIIKISLTGLMKVSHNESKTKINLMTDRFFEVFNAHGIPLVDIPKFLSPFKLPLSTFSNQDRLLDALNTDLLTHIAELFNVSLKWLQGIENDCLDHLRRWYKSPGYICQYLNELSYSTSDVEVLFISDSSEKVMREDRQNERYEARNSNIGILLKIPSQSKEGISYTKYQLWESGYWGYEKSRMDLKVIMLFCVQNHFNLRGVELNKPDFQNLFQRKVLPITIFKNSCLFWEPVDYVISGYHGDKDTDELFRVVQRYCDFNNIYSRYDGKGRPGRSSLWDQFALDLTKYIPGVTTSIEELLSERTKKYNSSSKCKGTI